MNVAEELAKRAIIPVIVINDANDAEPLAEALLAGGIDVIEVTFRTAAAADAINRIAKRFPKMLLGAGTQVPNPAEVFGASRLEELMHRLKERYQYVVIDTSPVLPSSDTGVLAARADGTLLVVRLEHSVKKQTREALRTVQDMGGNVLGCFVTDLRGQDPDSDRGLSYQSREES